MEGTIPKRKVKVKGPNSRLKRRLAEQGHTYQDVARLCSVTWFTVWAVLNNRRVSARVMQAARTLAGENGQAA